MWKKLKAALFTSGFWSAAWAAWGAVIGVGVLIANGAVGVGAGTLVVAMAKQFAVAGFMGGLAFAGVVALVHRGKRIEDISAGRLGVAAAFSGMLVPATSLAILSATQGAIVLPAILSPTVLGVMFVAFGAPAAATAWGMMKMAKAGEALPGESDYAALTRGGTS
ncbi:MAG: hypothetical protein AAF389_00745 [Gemmatimonadota bacterium]